MADLADSSDTQGTVTAMEISNSLDVTHPKIPMDEVRLETQLEQELRYQLNINSSEEPAAVDAHP